MPNIPCPDKIDCQCADGSPFRNLSSEAPDVPTFLGVNFFGEIPPLGYQWDVTTCRGVCRSTVSQAAADLCAAQAATTCVIESLHPPGGGGGSTPPVPPPQPTRGSPFPVTVFSNNAQSCAVLCPDGLPFTYQVPAHVFSARSQAQADAMAKSYACRQAQLHRICLSNITDFVCVDSGYSQVITASGGFLALPGQVDNWQIVAGGLPAGLTFNGGTVQGGAVSITGTPTEIGIFSFTVQITAPNGDMMQKPYTLTVAGIVNADALPDGTVGTAYTAQLVAVGFVNPLFSIVAGTLPDGLTMDGTGLISGTPTTDEVDTLTFGVEENP